MTEEETSFDYWQYLNMPAFDDIDEDVNSTSPKKPEAAQETESVSCPTQNVIAERPKTPLLLPSPYPLGAQGGMSAAHAKARPASWQPFTIPAITSPRTFTSPFVAHPQGGARPPLSIRQRQNSDGHSAVYDSTAESSAYEEPWFSSSSQSILSPGSPQSGYHSTGSLNDSPGAGTLPHRRSLHRPSHSYSDAPPDRSRPTTSGPRSLPSMSHRALTLGIREPNTSTGEESPSSPKRSLAGPEDAGFQDSHNTGASGDDSEYVETYRGTAVGPMRKRPKKSRTAERGFREDDEDSVGLP